MGRLGRIALIQVAVVGSVLAAGLFATPPAGASVKTAQDDVVRLTNAERQRAGCAPLNVVTELNQAAQGHSQDMATHNFMGHIGSDGSTVEVRVERAGYTGWWALAENVAAGQRTPEAAVAWWMGSPGHRANILNCALKDIGVGYATNPNSTYGVYWTQNFGSR
ncbi:CAP domain-containing protein [Kutzneria sp. CA-103260]|uniref:CAP domain-containing protein n=1 Tax=Kutzneria sp. CA-103260 TaxID=2802641 RepID=UPI001BAA47BC|nr:CAP domain-containing protein [Kutzneria sp. CA-103260]QUQ68906.1 sigma-70 family RNA polymerase sigma factor [Kutzneria sp. CA-103260]